MENKLNIDQASEFVENEFKTSILDSLCEYVRIPNLSPNFDPEWSTNGNQEKATTHLLDWVNKQGVKGLKAELIQESGRTSIIFMEVAAQGGSTKNHFMYGHFDKQPHFTGWAEGLGPTTPVIKGDRLYGRGGADDGYAIYACIAGIKAVQAQNRPHARIVIIIEGSEESGSPDLVPYLNKLKDRIGTPDIVFCLDSGCLDYDTLWITTSLRGVVMADFHVEVMEEAVHSGSGGGIAPDSFMIIRNILDRIENSTTGEVDKVFQVEIPKHRVEEMEQVAKYLGKGVYDKVKLLPGVKPTSDNHVQVLKNSTWMPSCTIIGASGFPPHKTAGNVLRASTDVRLSVRLPPTKDGNEGKDQLVKMFTENPPFNAKVENTFSFGATGFNSKAFSEKLRGSLDHCSQKLWGKPSMLFGEGGSIPFMNSLLQQFPSCEFVVVGVLGPESNAHSVNEFLHIPYCKKIVTTVSYILADMA